MLFAITAVVGIIVGGVLGFVIWNILVGKKSKGAKAKAEKIIDEARNQEKEYLLKAKDEALKIKDDAEKEIREKSKYVEDVEKELRKR